MHSDAFVWKSLRLLGPSAGEREQMRQAATLLLQQADDPKKGKNDANKKKDGSTTASQKEKKQTVATVDEEVEGIDGMKATLTLAFRYVPASFSFRDSRSLRDPEDALVNFKSSVASVIVEI